MSRNSRGRNRKPRPHPNGSNRITGQPETQIQQLTAELAVMRSQLTDLKLREAVARGQAEALQIEVERLKARLAGGMLGRLVGFCRGAPGRGSGLIGGSAVSGTT